MPRLRLEPGPAPVVARGDPPPRRQRGVVSDVIRRPSSVVVAAGAVGWVYFAANYWVYTVTGALLSSVAVLGLWVLIGWGREVSLAQAGLLGTGVYVCGYLSRTEVGGKGWPFLAALAGAVLVTGALSLVVSVICVRLSGVYVLVLTLALQFIVERVIFTKGELTGGIVPMHIPRPSLFGIELTTDRAFYFLALGLVAVVLLVLARLRRSRYGRALILVGSDRRSACALGVSPWRYKMFAFTVCGMLAGLAGAVQAPFFEAPPPVENYLSPFSLGFIAVPILAGIESMVAVVVVALLLLIVPTALQNIDIHFPFLGGLGLIAGTMLGPRGLGGAVMDRWRRLRRAGWRASAPGQTPLLGEAEADAVGEASAAARERAAGHAGFDHRRQDALEVFSTWLRPPADTPVALTATGVSLAFGGVQAVDDVSISVPAGAMVGLIGPNGAGKSTLFDIVNGLRRPDRGTVELFGRDVSTKRSWERAGLGMSRTFQANRINLEQSVKDNLLSGAYTRVTGSLAGCLAGLPSSWASMHEAERAARAVAVLVNVEHHWDEMAGALSFGNRRRVEIGRTLMSGARLLLLDEPAAGLDPTAAGDLFTLLKRLHQDLGVTVLLVEHYVRAVLANCDLVYVLAQGRVVASGAPEAIASHPDVRSQYLGADFDARILAARRPERSTWAPPE